MTALGRACPSHVALGCSDLSAVHCLLRPLSAHAGFAVIDARGRQGTRINDRPVVKGNLSTGDVLSVGPVDLELVRAAAGAPVPELPRTGGRAGWLVLAPSGGRAASIPLPPGSITVLGRGPHVHARLHDEKVSAYHCLIGSEGVEGGEPFVIDLWSRNGTFVDGEAIECGRLEAGAVLSLGETQFLVRRLTAAEIGMDTTTFEALLADTPPPRRASPPPSITVADRGTPPDA